MATTLSKLNGFESAFQKFIDEQVKEIGVSKEILNKIVQEAITTKVTSVSPIETILIASAAKAAASKAASKESPKAVAPKESPKAVAPKESPKAVAPKTAAASGGAGSSPVETVSPTLRYKEVVTSTLKMGDIGAWSDVELSDAAPANAAPAWKVEAHKEFTTFTKVAFKKGGHVYFFHRRTIPEILTSLKDSRLKKHPEDTLMEWLHNLPSEKVGPWLEDVTTRADFRNESSRFTIATILYAFIPFFVKHNLTKNVVSHLGYCTSFVAIPEPSNSEVSIATYFGLSPGDEPTEQMLREVALGQAIQNYVLSQINSLLTSNKTKYKIRSIETDGAGDIKVSFPSEEAVEKFSDTMKYNMRTDGFL